MTTMARTQRDVNRALNRGRWLAQTVAVGAVVLVSAAGCRPSVSSQGRERDVLAAYQFGTLDSKLGPEMQVLTVKAAAEQSLRSRGYVIEKVSGGADRARIQARTAGQGGWDKVVVESWVGDRFTGVSVKVEPWGDEAESRAILDAMLNRLGR